MPRLPAEWEEQDAVLLAWPHAGTDWASSLDRAVSTYVQLVRAITRFEEALVVAPETGGVEQALKRGGVGPQGVRLIEVPTNDTWTRDYGPLAVETDGTWELLDFGFNGWGLKYPADRDNRVTRHLAGRGTFAVPRKTVGLVLEGGSVESDGRGTILTTSECLLGPNRNPHLDRAGVERALTEHLGARRVLWLEHGHLTGDDTDGHVDTLARFAPGGVILHVTCPDAGDEHFEPLAALADELRRLRGAEGRPFRLLELPWPRPVFDAAGRRLPATYANFLVVNGAVLVPTYDDPADASALAVVGAAFPGREVLGVPCRSLLEQGGSLHCATMQLPKGVLA